MPRRLLAALLGLLLSLTLVACGDDDTSVAASDEPGTEAAGFPVTIATSSGELTIEAPPTAIISLGATHTETLFAIGAGDRVIAVDEYSNYPPEVPDGDLDAYEPSVEAISARNPDLVVLTNDTNDIVAQLRALEIPVLLQEAPADIDGVYQQIVHLGLATGQTEEADDLIASMKDDLAEIIESADVDGLTYYYELDSNYYSQTSHTFLGWLIGELGLVNIADDAAGGSDYPQLSAEHIIDMDPDLILLADTKCCGQNTETVRARAGWSGLSAVAQGGVVELDDDIASRWGPRLVDLLRQVADAAAKVAAAA